jgi:hypothetical protein
MGTAIRAAGGLGLLLVPVTLLGAEPLPPALDVVLTPHAAGGSVNRLDVRLRIASPGVAAGKTLLRMPLTIVSIPTARYDAAAIQASDERGPLTLVAVDEPPTPTGVYRHFDIERATAGDVVLRYGTSPRAVSSATRSGPLFDLRTQAAGIMGAGVYFFALPDTHYPYRITLKWDLSGMPVGSRGIWSLGEGEQSTVAPADTLAFSYYAAGPVKSEPANSRGNFALYWIVEPSFKVVELADCIRKLYGYMSRFFTDEGAPYRVFIRADPYPGGSGTALAKSFVFGYGPDVETNGRDRQMLLAHEMVHNWPRLNGEVHSETAWYTEGTAEYYSAARAARRRDRSGQVSPGHQRARCWLLRQPVPDALQP